MDVQEVAVGRDYDALYREVGPRLWRTIVAYAGGRIDIADDVVSEAFARAMTNDAAIRNPVPWLYRIAFRLAAAELRRRVESHGDEEPGYVPEYVSLDLVRALRALPPSQRAAVYLHYQADLSLREVARLTGSSIGATKVQLHRGRKRLRQLLSEEDPDD